MQVKQRHASAGPSGIEGRRTKVRRENTVPLPRCQVCAAIGSIIVE